MTQQLWQAAKLASVGELAASIAHELNNPLATVILRIESVLARHAPEARGTGTGDCRTRIKANGGPGGQSAAIRSSWRRADFHG